MTVGWWAAAIWFAFGVMFAMTIIGLPLAWVCFKLAAKAFDPWAKARAAAPPETVTRIIYEHHYYDHRNIVPTGPKGGEPMPEPVPVVEPEPVREELVLDQPAPANDDVAVPARRRWA